LEERTGLTINKKVREMLNKKIGRREILRMGLVTAAATLIHPHRAIASTRSFLSAERKLTVYNVHFDEYLETVYWRNHRYIPDALAEVNYIFRDRITGKIKDIHPGLLDLLCEVQQRLGYHKPVHIVSGYRTPRANAYLRKTTKGVAWNSLHMYGKAVDIRLPGNSLNSVRRLGIELGQGGVGYYPHSNFVHLDIGSVRYWEG
jgi:uncharacterized protein YcbK (DUF882 family)